MAANAGEDVGRENHSLPLVGLQMNAQIMEDSVGFCKHDTFKDGIAIVISRGLFPNDAVSYSRDSVHTHGYCRSACHGKELAATQMFIRG